MTIWQADFYYHPTATAAKQWELAICDRAIDPATQTIKAIYLAPCSAADANADWLEQQLRLAARNETPEKIEVFRPQSLGLISVAAQRLGIPVVATRNTIALKQILLERHQQHPNYSAIAIEKSVPQPLPENLWGDEWQIANIAAGQIIDLFSDRPIPICHMPQELHPLNLNLTSDIFIPGVVVFGGRQSMQLARWIEQQTPAFINYIPTEVGKSGGFILETGLADRWVFNTFDSPETAAIARKYEQSKSNSQGLHFLLIQPDDSGMTTTAFWLLQQSDV
ncbi:MAG: Tab2/Atab2 family RNA-binding protein [Cyanobacteria bacterium J06600_6]